MARFDDLRTVAVKSKYSALGLDCTANILQSYQLSMRTAFRGSKLGMCTMSLNLQHTNANRCVTSVGIIFEG